MKLKEYAPGIVWSDERWLIEDKPSTMEAGESFVLVRDLLDGDGRLVVGSHSDAEALAAAIAAHLGLRLVAAAAEVTPPGGWNLALCGYRPIAYLSPDGQTIASMTWGEGEDRWWFRDSEDDEADAQGPYRFETQAIAAAVAAEDSEP